MNGHHAVMINDPVEAHQFFQSIGVDPETYSYMLTQAVYRCLKLRAIPCRTAIIIKQEMLSKGGEVAISREALRGEGRTDILLMGTILHYRLLIEKLKVQPLELQQLAGEIQNILVSLETPHKIIDMPRGKYLELGKRTLVMGILNVTPDSFSDGGRFFDLEKAVEHALQMVADGADIIDIGAVSSRPQAVLTGEEEELKRIIPVVKRLAREDMIISVDTFRGRVARYCLDEGAHIINDIGALKMDAAMLPVLVAEQAPVILMHNRMHINQHLEYRDLIDDIVIELEESMQKAEDAGLNRQKIIIDPGLGFGKTPAQNLQIVKRLREFKSLGQGLLLGASRKRFIGHIIGAESNDRLEGSLAIAAIAIANGADIIRVHDVKASRRVALMADAVTRAYG